MGQHTVIGIENSLTGLLHRPPRVRLLSLDEVTPILERGGTILGTSSRGNIFDEGDEEQIRKVVEGYLLLGLDALIVVGGEGTQKLAKHLVDKGLNVIGVPKTIDNDLPGTDQTIGFSTAADIAAEAVLRLKSTAESHDRIMILEVMGRDSGYIALHSGLASGANVILIPEIPFSYDAISAKIEERRRLGRLFSVIVAAEGAYPEGKAPFFKHPSGGGPRLGGIGQDIAQELHQRTGFETRVTVLGHVQRGGTPNREDRIMGTMFGAKAMEMAINRRFGRFVALINGTIGERSYDDIETGARLQIDIQSNQHIATAESIGISLGRLTPFVAQP